MVKPCLYQNTKISQTWWHVPIVPATQEAEAGELLEPRRQKLHRHPIPNFFWCSETPEGVQSAHRQHSPKCWVTPFSSRRGCRTHGQPPRGDLRALLSEPPPSLHPGLHHCPQAFMGTPAQRLCSGWTLAPKLPSQELH
ncbi:hypothetical protein AAY473_000818 [Plecturocebus cupreus]